MKKFIFIVAICFGFTFFVLPSFAFATAHGPKLFKEYYCIDCHTLGHEGGTVGPDLSYIGKTKSLSWIETQIIDPKVHFTYGVPTTISGHTYLVIMPTLNKISSSQLDIIAKYLESLK